MTSDIKPNTVCKSSEPHVLPIITHNFSETLVSQSCLSALSAVHIYGSLFLMGQIYNTALMCFSVRIQVDSFLERRGLLLPLAAVYLYSPLLVAITF